jgi:hypothetical protein
MAMIQQKSSSRWVWPPFNYSPRPREYQVLIFLQQKPRSNPGTPKTGRNLNPTQKMEHAAGGAIF